MIDGMAMKGKRITTSEELQQQAPGQLHSGHMGIEEKRLLARVYMYLVNMNAGIETTIKNFSTCLQFQQT